MRKRLILVAAIAAIALVAAACTSNDSSSSSGAPSSGGAPIDITMWHGYGKVIDNQGQSNYEAKSLTDLVDQYNAINTGVHVTLDYIGTNDNAYNKLTVALQGGWQPDITYQYGTSMAALAQTPYIMNLTDRVQDPGFNWNDFSEGARAAATVEGQVYGVPALIDNLAIVYDEDLFQAAGVDEPTADWTWDDFRAAAKALTDPSKQQYGFAFPIDSSEDTVWHYDAMLWEAGGDILNADNTQAAFNSPAGVEALTTLQQMAVTDKSVFLDQQNVGKIDDLFNAEGKIVMDVTGPWALSRLSRHQLRRPDHADVRWGLAHHDRRPRHVGDVRQRRRKGDAGPGSSPLPVPVRCPQCQCLSSRPIPAPVPTPVEPVPTAAPTPAVPPLPVPVAVPAVPVPVEPPIPAPVPTPVDPAPTAAPTPAVPPLPVPVAVPAVPVPVEPVPVPVPVAEPAVPVPVAPWPPFDPSPVPTPTASPWPCPCPPTAVPTPTPTPSPCPCP